MMKHARFLTIGLLLATGLSCDSSAGLEETGSISIALLTPSDAASQSSDLQPVNDAPVSVTLTSARIRVTGPTTRTQETSTATGTSFNLTVDQLAPGTYAVVVEGLVDGQVAHIGAVTGVVVTAGRSTTTTVGFPSFQPVIPDASITDTLDILRFTVSYNAVPSATSYIVSWSQSPDMSGAESKTTTETTTEVAVTAEGKYYVTVRAVNPLVASGGLASVPKTVYLFQGVAEVTVSAPATTLSRGETVQLTAEARDADDNVVSNVEWFWASSNHSVATVSETGLVTGVGLGSVQITALGKGTPGRVDMTVNVTATQLAFVSQPGNRTAGQALDPAIQVEVRDASGVRVNTSRIPVTIALGTNPGAGTLSGTATVNAIDGIATFSGLWIDKAGTGYTLAAGATDLPGASSSAFDIAPSSPAKLAFVTQPSSATVGTTLAAVEVEVQDPFGNRTTAAVDVGLGFFSNPSGATLGGTLASTSSSGVATFGDLTLNEIGAGYRLIAVADGLTSVVSSAFNGMLRAYVVNAVTGSVSVFEASDNSHVTDISVGVQPLQMIVSPDGTRGYVTLFGSGSVAVLDLTNNTALPSITVGSGPQGLAISPDGSTIIVANSGANTITFINTATNTPSAPVAVGTFPTGVAFTPNGLRAYVVNQNTNNVSVIDVATQTVATTVASGGTLPRNVATSPDGQVAYVTNGGTDNVTVIRVSTNAVVTTFPAGDSPTGVVFDPTSRLAYVVHNLGHRVGVIANGGLSLAHSVVDYIQVENAPRKIAISPTGAYLYVPNGGSDNATVISTATRKAIGTLSTGAAGLQPWGVALQRVP